MVDNDYVTPNETLSGFLFKIAPSLSFGINELTFNYSLGSGNFKYNLNDYTYKYSIVCNDLHFDWLFNVGENIGFGPTFSMALRTDKEKENDGVISIDQKIGGYNYTRFGLQFVASF
jgi:hypothetical protein